MVILLLFYLYVMFLRFYWVLIYFPFELSLFQTLAIEYTVQVLSVSENLTSLVEVASITIQPYQGRSDNNHKKARHQPHALANWARKNQQTYTGDTLNRSQQKMKINPYPDAMFFRFSPPTQLQT